MHIKNKRGQSTVEYVLLVTAVVAVIIAFVTTKNGAFQGQLTNVVSGAAEGIATETTQLTASHLPSPANAVPAPYSVTLCGGAGQPACSTK